MPNIQLKEIRKRLSAFSAQWKDASRENADAKLFWARFYECYGIRAESATIYEKAVAKLSGAHGFIDSFIPGKLIVEHKSRGKNLDSAFMQAADYFLALSEAERPRYIIISDFARFRVHDLKSGQTSECKLSELSKRANWFRFLSEDDSPEIVEESPINRRAAYAISDLHEALLRSNFRGHDLEVFLTRLLFCLFADRTGIFGADLQFLRVLEGTRIDGADVGARLAALFDVLDTPVAERQHNIDDQLVSFEYINGSLFSERTRIPAFDSEMRLLLMNCALLSWTDISPAIFGAMFQGVLESHTPTERRQASRRELGAHYTSERNILRVIDPLFMDALRSELKVARRSKPRLKALYDKLKSLTFLDPACGCGNFLVIAYRELRRLENEVIADLFDFEQGRGLLDVSTLCRVRVSQFYGIEIDEAAAHIARVALWITDHQMNIEAAERFGTTRPTVPLVDTPHIHHKNALQSDWSHVLNPSQCNFIVGNPPFIGKSRQTPSQKSDMRVIFSDNKKAGVLDYVSAWYAKAAAYIKDNPKIDVAFVSTNSITQGEQVAVLWPMLLKAGIKIRFAHRTFVWRNDGKGNAAVHCVIVGFGLQEPSSCVIYDYSENTSGEGKALSASRISPYLVDAPDVLLTERRRPLFPVPEMRFGSMPNDGGHLLLTDEEKANLLAIEPGAAPYIRAFVGAVEFINGLSRWCLWLQGVSPASLRSLPEVYKRVEAVKAARLASGRPETQKLAATPYLFGEIRQPTTSYLLVPSATSENREYIPIGFMQPETIASNLVLTIAQATNYEFAVLCSSMHNAWLRSIGGRLKSDPRYSAKIVYNNFPWPTTVHKREALAATGQAILDARKLEPGSTLADLYDPNAMSDELRKAHVSNDRLVDAAYGYRGGRTDAARVAHLLSLYEKSTSLFIVGKKPKRTSKKLKKVDVPA